MSLEYRGRIIKEKNLKYSVNTYYKIMLKVSTIGLFHAVYPEAKIKIYQNQRFMSDFCPFHNNTLGTLALLIDEKEVYWLCYGCGEGGMSVDLLIKKYSLNGNDQDRALEILSWLCNEPLSELDAEQQAIYNSLKENYLYDNPYKRISDKRTKLIALRFRVYLDKYGWTREIYNKASRRFGKIRSNEIDLFFDKEDEKARQKVLKNINYNEDDLPF